MIIKHVFLTKDKKHAVARATKEFPNSVVVDAKFTGEIYLGYRYYEVKLRRKK